MLYRINIVLAIGFLISIGKYFFCSSIPIYNMFE